MITTYVTWADAGRQVLIAPDPVIAPPPGWKPPRQGIAVLWLFDECAKSYDDWYYTHLSTVPATPTDTALPYPNRFMQAISTMLLALGPAQRDNQHPGMRIVKLRFAGRLYPGAVLYLWGEHNSAEPSSTTTQKLDTTAISQSELSHSELVLDSIKVSTSNTLLRSERGLSSTKTSLSSVPATYRQSTSMERLNITSKDTASVSTSHSTATKDMTSSITISPPAPDRLEPSIKYVKLPVAVYSVDSTTAFTRSDSNGVPRTTQTDFHGEVYLINTLTTLTAAHGSPILTTTTQVPIAPATTTLTDTNGVPTATVTTFSVCPHLPHSTAANLMLPNRASYFTIYFLLILFTILLLIPIQAIGAKIKQLLPFRHLTKHDSSATAGIDALVMQPGCISGWKLLWHYGDSISLLSVNLSTCFLTVAVFPVPARVAGGLLGAPGCVGDVAGLHTIEVEDGNGGGSETREVLMEEMTMSAEDGSDQSTQVDTLLGKRCKNVKFRLGRLENWTGKRADDYGIIVLSASGSQRRRETDTSSNGEVDTSDMVLPAERTGLGWIKQAGRSLPVEKMVFHVPRRERAFQGALLGVLCGLLTLILYYELTEYEDLQESLFEWFMDSQGFGARM
ncbi:hypothetical protein QBC36DRAFT_377389 [Triangularia setosa]|uniref:Uncharacterized protein n=1 Tax=Triangularia setosa TaxID=2587417 RepID=A0AAN7A739_9PEZI|nr:hypothetical protein QBC36DRAFT_377389 [Podospora setosa]